MRAGKITSPDLNLSELEKKKKWLLQIFSMFCEYVSRSTETEKRKIVEGAKFDISVRSEEPGNAQNL